jgi:DNA polymerase-3 subunit gamma/tau
MAKKKSPSQGSDAAAPDAPADASPASPDGAVKQPAPTPAAAAAPTPYVVLARKYRPETFVDLIGQDAMVRILRNAFETDRIAQGYMLTGVRGVGKTTTARILARALNYVKEGFPDRPTVEMDGYGQHCQEIILSRHPDVLEMDAASNTGIDNIREIIESARYKPLLARYKVFIIDEVHMLSKGAFNALLKTLEEPPDHVKFIFATTEIRKVPVTVLSRCQRFDLRRVDVPVLVRHFEHIVANEGATAEPDALAAIARAAEGSVRDGLSLLDQAIAMGSGRVTAEAVRAMLGLADRGRIFDLVELMLGGKPGPAILALEALHKDGAEPQQVLADLADSVHIATRIRIAGVEAAGEGLSAEERRRATTLAGQLSVPLLARAWQMLLKGLEEVARAPDQLAAAEMVLIRIAHTADLPTPDAVIRALGGPAPARLTAGAPTAAAAPQAAPGPLNAAPSQPLTSAPNIAFEASIAPSDPAEAPAGDETPAETIPVDLCSFADVVELVGDKRDMKLKYHLEEHVGLVRFEPGRVEMRPLDGAPANLAGTLAERLTRWTGRRWIVVVSREAGAPSLAEARRAEQAAELARLKEHPALKAVLEVFPEADVKEIRSTSRQRKGGGT